ncbi:MAG TPA: translation elongation factor 4 [Calditrichia bacterium]|nr:translation elongation factor 4 [Calditrichota bacterium]HQV31061.1 translation elongation factor 4 [Calditrichia bacterium]
MQNIRNFCIIAHIDHGKSTLADRLLEFTGALDNRQMQAQVLDSMDLERERGITIKSHAIRMDYTAPDGQSYIFNLVDTPGHVDFAYEVSRSLAAAEGALLLVDAAQGVEAQTISTLYQAIDNDLVIIPVINKIDLPSAEIEKVSQQIVDLIGCDADEILHASAKSGLGITEIVQAVIDRVPPPQGNPDGPLQALIFDSQFDAYRGVIALVKVFNGELKPGQGIRFLATGRDFEVEEVGSLLLKRVAQKSLATGQVGYLICGAKDVRNIKVGDTVTLTKNGAPEPLPGYRQVKPMVFAGIYPVDSQDFEDLRLALEKLVLNDSSLLYEPETSSALGFGFRCGFLGLLHMEIVQERLEREFDQTIIVTTPNVIYRVTTTDGKVHMVDNPSRMPDPVRIEILEEPYIDAHIITPPEYIGNIMKLVTEKRGMLKNQSYLDPTRADLHYHLPLAEVVFDFFDRLKSNTRGYASLDYEFMGYRESKLVKLDILINGEILDALSIIVHKDKAYENGRLVCQKLRKIIPRQMFEVIIQAGIGNKIIARETVKALRKNVLAKCYGGDISRKRKLLEKQKEGKKRMKQVGRVEIPQEAFLAVLSTDE